MICRMKLLVEGAWGTRAGLLTRQILPCATRLIARPGMQKGVKRKRFFALGVRLRRHAPAPPGPIARNAGGIP